MPLSIDAGPAHNGPVSVFVDGPSSFERQTTRRRRRQARDDHRILIDRGQTGPPPLLVAGAEGHEGFARRANRRWIRGLAGVLAFRLDRQLAAGLPPETNRLIAARADSLVSLPVRSALARHWRDLLTQATRPPVARTPTVPICRDRIMAAEADIRATLEALSARLPVPARGVAAANRLLTDGTGPLYNRSSPVDLVDAVREVVELLDPATSLSPGP
jgi:hypothetical protein